MRGQEVEKGEKFTAAAMHRMTGQEGEKSEKFREAAIRRVRNVETTLRRVRNLSNPTSYAYTEEEIDRIFAHLQGVLDRTRDSFSRSMDRNGFSL
ncbi:hypothetical protein [Acuticoccus sp.]|uniref:hypothetical protein n=1 Tax=Acuticoccus sp. TaxID=1904378 RepID=UPI003B52F6B4